MQAKGLSPNDVVNAVSAQNLILPSGYVAEDRRVRVRRGSECESKDGPEELNDLPVKSTVGNTIYVRDVKRMCGMDFHHRRAMWCAATGCAGRCLTVQKVGATSRRWIS